MGIPGCVLLNKTGGQRAEIPAGVVGALSHVWQVMEGGKM